MNNFKRSAAVAALIFAPASGSAQTMPLGVDLERFDYPYPVHWFETRQSGVAVRMAYMDVAPTAPAQGRVVVLLHGKNFCAATWSDTAGTGRSRLPRDRAGPGRLLQIVEACRVSV